MGHQVLVRHTLANARVRLGAIASHFERHAVQVARQRTTNRYAFVNQRGDNHFPAAIDFANDIPRGHADVGQEYFIEVGFATRLTNGAHGDAGRLHVNDEDRQPFVLRLARVGSRHQQGPGSVPCMRRPHLLAIDDEITSRRVMLGARQNAGKIGTSRRLRVELTPNFRAFECRANMAFFVLRARQSQ